MDGRLVADGAEQVKAAKWSAPTAMERAAQQPCSARSKFVQQIGGGELAGGWQAFVRGQALDHRRAVEGPTPAPPPPG